MAITDLALDASPQHEDGGPPCTWRAVARFYAAILSVGGSFILIKRAQMARARAQDTPGRGRGRGAAAHESTPYGGHTRYS